MSKNQTDQTETDKNHKTPYRQRNRLLGKVVLLIGSDPAVLQNLVIQLAQKGADIALLCRHIPQEEARKMKESVQTEGTRLCLIEQVDYNTATATQMIDNIIAKMGHLDIFIDLSTQKPRSTPDNIYVEESKFGFNFPNWQMTQAALEEIAHV